jgi:hypothetical protein
MARGEGKIKPACRGLGSLPLCLTGREEEITAVFRGKERITPARDGQVRLRLHLVARKDYPCIKLKGNIPPALN